VRHAEFQTLGKIEKKGKEEEARHEEVLEIHDEEDGIHGVENVVLCPRGENGGSEGWDLAS
jgi:hypothetical protein